MDVKLGKILLKKITGCFEHDEILDFPEVSENEKRWSVEEHIEELYILDLVVRTYYCKGTNGRWPVALFYNMVDVSAVNA